MDTHVDRAFLSRRRFLANGATALGAAASIAGLAACSPAAPTAPPPAAATTVPAAPAPAAKATAPAAASQFVDSLNYSYPQIADTLDPLNVVSVQGHLAQRPFHEALVILDEKGTVTPLLAESWKAINPTTWQFVLRRGVKFHNGDDLTADAVVATVDRLVKTQEPLHQNLKSRIFSVASAQKVDERTVNIVTSAPDPGFLRRISLLFISHPKLYSETDKTILTRPIGTGPYMPTAFEKGSGFSGEAFPNHWRAKPTIRSFKYHSIAEPATLLAAVKAGDIDVAVDIPGSQANDLRNAGLQVLTKPFGATWVYDLSMTLDTPLKDKRVRQALNYAVDKDVLVKTVFGGAGRVVDGQITGPDAFGYNPELKSYPYDVERAKSLLKEAGVGSFAVKVGLTPRGKELSEAIQGFFKVVGVDLEILIKDPSLYSQGTSLNNPPREAVWWWRTDYFQVLDADLALRNFISTHPSKRGTNPAFDKVMEDASRELDEQKRAALLRQASVILRDDAPVLFLNQHGIFWAYSAKLQNFQARYDVSTPFEELNKLR